MRRVFRGKHQLAYNAHLSEVTSILERVRGDDPQAADQLLPLVYEELRKLASRAQNGERTARSDSLQPTALVHEAWLRLVGDRSSPKFETPPAFWSAVAGAEREE